MIVVSARDDRSQDWGFDHSQCINGRPHCERSLSARCIWDLLKLVLNTRQGALLQNRQSMGFA